MHHFRVGDPIIGVPSLEIKHFEIGRPMPWYVRAWAWVRGLIRGSR